MGPRPQAMERRLHSACVGVFSTSGGQGRSELWPVAGRAVDVHPKVDHSEPQRGTWWKGAPRFLGMGRIGYWPAVAGVPQPWAQRAPRCCCALTPHGPMGPACPCSLAQKVPWGITSIILDIQVMLGGCARRERPWAVFCDWVYTCGRGDSWPPRSPPWRARCHIRRM
jgi:hypothetical protein